MKSKMKRRMLAIVLCMVIVLSNSSFIFASSGTEEPAAVAQEGDPQNVQETQTEAAVQDTPAVLSETTPEATPEATPEPTQVPEVTAAPTEAPQATVEPTQVPEVTAAPEATPAPTETPAVTAEPTQAPEVTVAPETTPEATPVPTEAPVTYNEAVELRHEFKDENGNVTATVTAQIPAGAFQADASELTMEVTVPDQATTEHVKKLMEESLPEHYMLGDTVLYDIRFKVNGTETESQQPIVITFENQNGITVKDVKKAVVFQLDPADPAVEGDKDELVTITQRNDMIESLQNSGQSTDNVDDYDLSEITLKEDGTSNKIQMEGRTSTIYGCYAYYEPVQVLTYEDDQVTVTVSAAENGVIPANAELKVVPITEDKETEDQYKDVEKKLQEKAEEEEYEIAGFLAYDITFVDPDGNETEPNGEVKVSIDYKEAAIPESVSEEDVQNAEVTVMHLEEDEKGEVKEVVDMAQTEKVDVLATTEENKVEKAEVKTESFSTFVIQWGNRRNQVTVHYVDESGTEIQGTQKTTVTKEIATGVTLSEYADTIEDYIYTGAYLNSYDSGIVATKIKFSNGNGWEYTGESGRYVTWPSSGFSRNVYLVYKLQTNTELTTVDTKSKGVTINLFDYQATNSGTEAVEGPRYATEAINRGRTLKFFSGREGYGKYDWDINMKTDSNGKGIINAGMVNSQLGSDGFPVLGGTINSDLNESLGYLFNTSNISGAKASYTGLNHLFLEKDGYYVYDSDLYYAYLKKTTDGFESDFTVLDGNSLGFFPFTDASHKESNNGSRANGVLNSTDVNHYFGMTITTDFLQPKEGKINGQDMIFSFSGDDDVWVFIDDQLVLDLGGIHAAVSGTINFAEGTVTTTDINDGETKTYYLHEILGFDNDQKTFEDYSTHTMKFFYMERGSSASNCMIKFNLQTIPDDTIVVGKEITDSNASVYSDVEFSFKLETKAEGESSYSTVKDTTVKVYDRTGTQLIRTATVDADGIFKLKHGERAYFEDYPVTTQYKVTEVGVSSDEYDSVTITGVTVTSEDGGTLGKDYTTQALTVGKNPVVIFQNKIATSNQKELQITKQLNGTDSDNTKYKIQVYLGEEATDPDGTPYEGEYWIDDVSHEAVDGIIELEAGQTAAIVDIPSGTSFKVVEVDLDMEKYVSPSYSVTNADEPGTDDAATGKLILRENTKVTVINALLNTPDPSFIEVQKKFTGLTQAQIDSLTEFSMTVTNEWDEQIAVLNLKGGNAVAQGITISGPIKASIGSEITYTWKILNVEEGKYKITEDGHDEVAGYTVTTTVNGGGLGDTVDIEKPTYQIQKVGDGKITEQGSSEFTFDSVNVIVISFTGQAGYLVWTEDTLSLTERDAIVSAIGSIPGGGQFGSSNFNSNAKIVYFSTREIIQNGFDYRGHISVNADNTLKFTGTNQWNMIWAGTYVKNEGVNAEIEVKNTYTPEKIVVDLQKYGTDYTTDPLTGAKVELYKATEQKESDQSLSLKKGEKVMESEISGAHELSLENGYYILKEIKAPTGYRLLDKEILFKVENQCVQLLDGQYDAENDCYKQVLINQSGQSDIWKVELVNGIYTIKIKNEALYDLPSAGGSGIFWYLISGTAFLMAASLILYRMKRKEVLGK